MKVIPVIDVLNSIVVHAVKGNRKEYRPIESVLTNSVDPVEVATAFRLQGFSELYLADLDAILGNQPNFDLYERLAQMGFTLMIDAGVTDVETVKKLRACGVSKVIVGTETLQSISFVKQVIQQIGVEHVIVSLDLKAGQVLTHPSFTASFELFDLIRQLCAVGVSEFILLDLSRVGSSEGLNVELLEQVLAVLDGGCCGVYVGGGVGCVADLLSLKRLGVLGVLFASALHSGKIWGDVLVQLGLF